MNPDSDTVHQPHLRLVRTRRAGSTATLDEGLLTVERSLGLALQFLVQAADEADSLYSLPGRQLATLVDRALDAAQLAEDLAGGRH